MAETAGQRYSQEEEAEEEADKNQREEVDNGSKDDMSGTGPYNKSSCRGRWRVQALLLSLA